MNSESRTTSRRLWFVFLNIYTGSLLYHPLACKWVFLWYVFTSVWGWYWKCLLREGSVSGPVRGMVWGIRSELAEKWLQKIQSDLRLASVHGSTAISNPHCRVSLIEWATYCRLRVPVPWTQATSYLPPPHHHHHRLTTPCTNIQDTPVCFKSAV